MKEDYRHVSFSADIWRYREMQDYVVQMLERVLRTAKEPSRWLIEVYDAEQTKEASLSKIFAISADTVLVSCRNPKMEKGARLQIEDPVANDRGSIGDCFGTPYLERPAIISAHMAIRGDRGEASYLEDVVVVGELSARTEAIIEDILQSYLVRDVPYAAMAKEMQELTEQEKHMIERWRAESS